MSKSHENKAVRYSIIASSIVAAGALVLGCSGSVDGSSGPKEAAQSMANCHLKTGGGWSRLGWRRLDHEYDYANLLNVDVDTIADGREGDVTCSPAITVNQIGRAVISVAGKGDCVAADFTTGIVSYKSRYVLAVCPES